MRVIQVTRFGAPDVLVPAAVPDPVAGPGEAVISVAVADVLFLDILIRSGRAIQWFPVRPPYVPGNGVAGQVVSVGRDVDPGWIGRPVIARTGGQGGSGGYAEQAVVPAKRLVPVPDRLGPATAIAALHDGATALGLAASTGVRPGEWALVLGAAGGLGTWLVQLAGAAGAHVIGAARGGAKLAVIRAAGAKAVVDYSEPGWTKRVLDATGGADPSVVFDGVGGQLGREAFGVIASGGRFSAHGSPSGSFAPIGADEADRRQVTIRGIDQVQFGPSEHELLAGRALAELAAGRVRPVIGQEFPLDQAADAHAALEARAVAGKTLLTAR